MFGQLEPEADQSMILTNAALQSTGLLTINKILELENPQLVQILQCVHTRRYAKPVS